MTTTEQLMGLTLTPEKALIFRITHIDNLTWILANGLHARNGRTWDPNFRAIGNPELIVKRNTRSVPVAPFGVLSRIERLCSILFHAIFYNAYNIKTGYGVLRVPNEEIIILLSSLPSIKKLEMPFVFTNQHAYPVIAEYFNDLAE